MGYPTDRILLHGLVFHGKHGVFPEENVLGQKFEVDVELSTDLQTAGRTDDLQHSVNYAQVYDEVKTIVEGPPKNLIESVAEDIARTILKRHPRVQDVVVRVSKPHVAVAGVLDSLGIEITRGRG
eukprot:jgi/Pico_ML_1/52979/g3605.t2